LSSLQPFALCKAHAIVTPKYASKLANTISTPNLNGFG
jgi:hypothetical protein